MNTTMKTMAVAAGLLAVPFAAFAESAVTDSRAAMQAAWEHPLTSAETAGARKGNVSGTHQSRTDMGWEGTTAHIATPGNVWADNFRAGRVHEPADQ